MSIVEKEQVESIILVFIIPTDLLFDFKRILFPGTLNFGKTIDMGQVSLSIQISLTSCQYVSLKGDFYTTSHIIKYMFDRYIKLTI